MIAQSKQPSDSFSPDGYICDQDCFSSVRYRFTRADINGCGWIAAYNLRHFLGHDVTWESALRELDEMHTLPFPGPTLMRVMREYLAKYVPDCRETAGKEAAVAAAKKSRAGIFRYQEGFEPHFISFIRTEDGQFRFFNVADGLEDFCEDMDRFAEEHFRHGNVIALTVNTPTQDPGS